MSQSQILILLEELKEKLELTNILISHDLSVVSHMSDKIAVMYLGKVVEYGPAKNVWRNPLHPYTKALFNSVPSIDNIGMNSLSTIEGAVPSAINPPDGCRFHPRCPFASEICSSIEPATIEINVEHLTSCHLYSCHDNSINQDIKEKSYA
jgi:oligopeptide/dipeptide ABC transporter ATP-binding protein